MPHLCSVLFALKYISVSDTGHVWSRSIAILKKWENYMKAPIMESKNFFAENLLSTAVDFSLIEIETFGRR